MIAVCEKCIHYDICRDEYKDKLACSEFKNKADFEEVKHGEWQRQKNGFYFLCSACGKASATKGNYCHNCGCKMDGGRSE